MTLPADDLPDDIAALKAMLISARAAGATLLAANEKLETEKRAIEIVNLAFEGENKRLKAQNERYAHILRALLRAHFGRSSEKISDDQLNFALDDVQTAFAAEDALAEKANTFVKGQAVGRARPGMWCR